MTSRSRCKVRGYSSGMACRPATFRAWRVREIQRLHTRVVVDAASARDVIAEVAGVDLTEREHMIAIGVDRRNRVVSISDGTSLERSICAFRAMELIGNLFREGNGAESVTSVILGHNHPSGFVEPSAEDLASTKMVLCNFEGLNVIDHVIVGPAAVGRPSFYSMREWHPDVFRTARCT